MAANIPLLKQDRYQWIHLVSLRI